MKSGGSSPTTTCWERDWRLCTRRLQLDRGSFFHAVYRIQERLGRTFKELEPYALYPLDEYFLGQTAGDVSPKPARVVSIRRKSLHGALKVAVKKAAYLSGAGRLRASGAATHYDLFVRLTRRSLLQTPSIGLLQKSSPESFSRRAEIERYSPSQHAVEPLSPLSVGNGEFVFTADVTGLQTFPDSYGKASLCVPNRNGGGTARPRRRDFPPPNSV